MHMHLYGGTRHNMIIEIREKACVHVQHTRMEMKTIISHNTYMKGETGVWGGGGGASPAEANGMKRSQIK